MWSHRGQFRVFIGKVEFCVSKNHGSLRRTSGREVCKLQTGLSGCFPGRHPSALASFISTNGFKLQNTHGSQVFGNYILCFYQVLHSVNQIAHTSLQIIFIKINIFFLSYFTPQPLSPFFLYSWPLPHPLFCFYLEGRPAMDIDGTWHIKVGQDNPV